MCHRNYIAAIVNFVTGALVILVGILCGYRLARGQFPTIPAEAIDIAAGSGPRPGDVYIITDGTDTARAACALVANAVLSHTNNPVVPDSLGGGLLRVNLLALAPHAKDRERLVFILHQAGKDDPYFRDLYTEPVPLDGVKITGLDGKEYTKAERPLGAHLAGSQATLDALRAATGLRDCIFDGGYLLSRLSRQTNRGLYYDARGIGDAPLPEYLRARGLDWVLSQRIGAESRAFISRSGITGKPRVVLLLFGSGLAPHVGVQAVGITLDLTDEDAADPLKHPLVNLADFRGSAAEVFLTLPNGHVETTIWGADWKLAQTVPDNVATDATIPEPHTKRLEPFHSCIRCHGPHEFWQPIQPFDFRERGAVDLLSGRSPEEADALFFAYSGGNLSRPLDMARNTSNTASFYALNGDIAAGESASKHLATAHSAVYAAYNYEQVTPERACYELGCDAGSLGLPAGEVLSLLLPPGPDYDPRLRLLLAGQPLGRPEWEAVLNEALTMSQAGRDWLMWDYWGM